MLISLFLLFWRSSKRRSVRVVSFTEEGVGFDLGDCMLGGVLRSKCTCLYKDLTVQRDFGGLSVIKTSSGHSVLVPKSAITILDIRKIFEKYSSG